MVRLIVEESGKRRAFRLGSGSLTVGSAEDAKLVLESPGIAARHLELEIEGDGARVRVEPGVVSPSIDGETVLNEARLGLGQGLSIGKALLWLEDEASEPGSGKPVAKRAAPQPGGGSGGRTGGKAGGPSQAARARAIEAARKREPLDVVKRSKPRVQRGLPSWLVVGLVLTVLLVIGFVLRQAMSSSSAHVTSSSNLLLSAEEAYKEARWQTVLDKLKMINENDATPSERDRIRALRQGVDEALGNQVVAANNRLGTPFLETYLQKYESKYLQGNPTRSRVRLFLKRAQEFRRRWPDHPQMDWVARQEERFKSFVDLSQPPTIDDLDWEIELLLLTTPKRYETALDMLDEYLGRAGEHEADRDRAQNLKDKIIAERAEQFPEALQWARYEYEKKNVAKAVDWLVYTAAFMGDPEMEDDAARRLMEMPDLDGWLRAYKDERPDVWDALLENGVVRAKAKELGLL